MGKQRKCALLIEYNKIVRQSYDGAAPEGKRRMLTDNLFAGGSVSVPSWKFVEECNLPKSLPG